MEQERLRGVIGAQVAQADRQGLGERLSAKLVDGGGGVREHGNAVREASIPPAL
jgi:hypothetical protein